MSFKTLDSLALPSLEEAIVPLVLRAISPKIPGPESMVVPDFPHDYFDPMPGFTFRLEDRGPFAIPFDPQRRRATALFRAFSHSMQRAFRMVAPRYLLLEADRWEDPSYYLPLLYWMSAGPFSGPTVDLMTYDVLDDASMARAEAKVQRHLPALTRVLWERVAVTSPEAGELLHRSTRMILQEMGRHRVRCLALFKQEAAVINSLVQSLMDVARIPNPREVKPHRIPEMERMTERCFEKTEAVRTKALRNFWLKRSLEPVSGLLLLVALQDMLERALQGADSINGHEPIELPELVEEGAPRYIL